MATGPGEPVESGMGVGEGTGSDSMDHELTTARDQGHPNGGKRPGPTDTRLLPLVRNRNLKQKLSSDLEQ